ncbi:MAG: hypothetical protein IPH88_09735 [Bacteroidales bacterium]|nr:hypothetical protein [Bacteroidales bacterium]
MSVAINELPCFATETWNGSVSSDWNNAANWTPAAVPCATSAVIVPAGTVNFPTLSTPATVVSITVESGASFIGSEFLTAGSALVKQDFHLPDIITFPHLYRLPLSEMYSQSTRPQYGHISMMSQQATG